MRIFFTKEEIERLPKNFKVQDVGNGDLFIEQPIETIEEIQAQKVIEPSRLHPKRPHAIQYILEKTKHGYEVLRTNLKGIFAGHTQEKHDTKRGIFELLRLLRPEHEWIKTYEGLLEKWNTQNFPKEWSGFSLVYLAAPFDLVHYIVEEGYRTKLVVYTSPVKTIWVFMRNNESILVDHEKKANGIEHCQDLLEKEIKKHRLKTVYAAK